MQKLVGWGVNDEEVLLAIWFTKLNNREMNSRRGLFQHKKPQQNTLKTNKCFVAWASMGWSFCQMHEVVPLSGMIYPKCREKRAKEEENACSPLGEGGRFATIVCPTDAQHPVTPFSSSWYGGGGAASGEHQFGGHSNFVRWSWLVHESRDNQPNRNQVLLYWVLKKKEGKRLSPMSMRSDP